MNSLNSVGLGLSVVFTCLLLALVAEIYYLLWWKRRIIRRDIEDDYSSKPARELLYMFCWKKPSQSIVPSSSVNPTSTPQTNQSVHYSDFQFHAQNSTKNDYSFKPFDENGIETQMFTGPPRFLFTIKEETREDLESEDGKSRDGKRNSLCDLFKTIETPYLTPLASPQYMTPPHTPMGSCHSSQSGSGYNPFHESSSDAEFNRIVKTSPPPKFKFLRDAEEKLQRRNMLIEEAKGKDANLHKLEEYKDGSFIRIVIAKNKDNGQPNHHYHSPYCPSSSSSSSTSQVLPLASSHSTLAPSSNSVNSRIPS